MLRAALSQCKKKFARNTQKTALTGSRERKMGESVPTDSLLGIVRSGGHGAFLYHRGASDS
jgi:hypothetical protein